MEEHFLRGKLDLPNRSFDRDVSEVGPLAIKKGMQSGLVTFGLI